MHVTIVLKRGSAGKISGDNALDALVRIEKALREAKEERFPIISYVAAEELEDSSGDTDPDHLFEQGDKLIFPPPGARHARWI